MSALVVIHKLIPLPSLSEVVVAYSSEAIFRSGEDGQELYYWGKIRCETNGADYVFHFEKQK
jgi:hypothetical protein